MRRLDVYSRAAVPLLMVGFVLAACVGATASDGSPSPAAESTPSSGGVLITTVLTKAGYALAGPNGMTLYMLTKDHDGISSCTTGRCAEAWVALKGDAAGVRPGDGVSGTFGTTTCPSTW